MTGRQPLAIVLRIPDVKLSRDELSASLNVDISRYAASRHHPGHYAQIDIADAEDQWIAACRRIQSIRDPIRELISAGSIGVPSLEVGLCFSDSIAARFWVIPADLVAAAGEARIEIGISVYLSSEDSVQDDIEVSDGLK